MTVCYRVIFSPEVPTKHEWVSRLDVGSIPKVSHEVEADIPKLRHIETLLLPIIWAVRPVHMNTHMHTGVHTHSLHSV